MSRYMAFLTNGTFLKVALKVNLFISKPMSLFIWLDSFLHYLKTYQVHFLLELLPWELVLADFDASWRGN